MSQPTDYNPSTNFSQQEFDEETLPKHDLEYTNLAKTLKEVLHNLTLIQRDDGKLANYSVHPLALAPETIHLLNIMPSWRYAGFWEPYTLYREGDIVVFQNTPWVSVQCHWSGMCPNPDYTIPEDPCDPPIDEYSDCDECVDLPEVEVRVFESGGVYAPAEDITLSAPEVLFRVIFDATNTADDPQLSLMADRSSPVPLTLSGGGQITAGALTAGGVGYQTQHVTDHYEVTAATQSLADEWAVCFMVDFEQRERWLPLCCGAGGSDGSADCLRDATDEDDNGEYLIAADPDNPIVELVDGMRCTVRWDRTSVAGNETLKIAELDPKPLYLDALPVEAGDLVQNEMDVVIYNAVTDVFDLVGRDRVSIPVSETAWNTGDIRPTLRSTPALGWTFLDGSSIGNTGSGADREGAEYENLFNLVKNLNPNTGGEVWGSGDIVVLPDGRGRNLHGWSLMKDPEAPMTPGTESQLAGVFGNSSITQTAEQMPIHKHTVDSGGLHAHNVEVSSMQNTSGTARQADKYPDNSEFMSTRLGGTHSHTMQNAGGGQPMNIMNPVLVTTFEVKL
jgi:microcystin-dependent protein